MARAARPINPDDGPVQAFAFDLRALREAAGNPTYRTLAKAAGYSATTLGDAAGGVRFPTLEVTLAYVGACDADPVQWRERWQAVNRELAAQQSTAAGERPLAAFDDAENDVVLSEDCPVESVPGKDQTSIIGSQPPVSSRRVPGVRQWASWFGVALLGAAVAVGVTLLIRQPALTNSTAAAPLTGRSSSSGAVSPPGCPAAPAGPSTAPGGFSGRTYGPGANVRAGASMSAPIRERLPPGCTLRFSGYCVGDVVQDATSATPDMRWFILPGRGEVSSAIVHGDPPASVPPRPCPDDVPGPSAISLAISAAESDRGVVDLTAGGVQLWIVGFAAYYGTGPTGAAPAWHQLGMTTANTGSFNVLLRAGLVASAPPSRGVPVIAVACLGGDGATGVAASGVIEPGRASVLEPAPLAGAGLATAERAACQYPSGA